MPAQFWSMRPMRLAAPNFTRSRAFLAMVEASPDLIAVLDAGGRRLYANPALCSLLPAAVALTGSDSFSHIHPDDRSAVRKLFMRVLTDRQGRDTRYRIFDRHGRLRRLGAGGARVFPGAARLQGGLLLHADYCTRGACGRCPLSG